MKRLYQFIAGGSVVTPVGIAAAVLAARTLGQPLGWKVAPLYLAILLLTLAASTLERIQ